MSTRNYQAWLKAARRAAKRTGGLSLPAARKAYRKMAAHVGRPLKGTDVKSHPIIFRKSLPAKNRKTTRSVAGVKQQAGKAITRSKTGVRGLKGPQGPAAQRGARGGAVPGKAQQAGPPRVVVTEYVSSPEYKKLGPKGGFRLQLQVHITGPSGMNKKQLDRIAEDWLRNGKTPSGIEVKALGWNGKNPTRDGRGMRVARSNFRHIPFAF